MLSNINWAALQKASIPGFLRAERTLDFLKAAVRPFTHLAAITTAFRNRILFRLRYNAQVIYLEHMLNAVFNSSLPAYTSGVPTGIYIGPGANDAEPFFVYRKGEIETEDKWLYNKTETPVDDKFVWLYRNQEFSSLNYDFSIMVPIAVGNVSTNPILYNQIAAWVNLYNQAGKRFKIFNYTP